MQRENKRRCGGQETGRCIGIIPRLTQDEELTYAHLARSRDSRLVNSQQPTVKAKKNSLWRAGRSYSQSAFILLTSLLERQAIKDCTSHFYLQDYVQ
jgi:hypothetical protein